MWLVYREVQGSGLWECLADCNARNGSLGGAVRCSCAHVLQGVCTVALRSPPKRADTRASLHGRHCKSHPDFYFSIRGLSPDVTRPEHCGPPRNCFLRLDPAALGSDPDSRSRRGSLVLLGPESSLKL